MQTTFGLFLGEDNESLVIVCVSIKQPIDASRLSIEKWLIKIHVYR